MTEFLSSLHPKMVHFPVALLFTAGLLELLFLIIRKRFISDAALLLLFIGVFTSVAALVTGEQAALQAREMMKSTSPGYQHYLLEIERHEDAATIVVWVFTLLLILRGWLFIKIRVRKQTISSLSYLKVIIVLLTIAGMYFLYQAGDLGGRLVYKHGIGTELFKEGVNQQDTLGTE